MAMMIDMKIVFKYLGYIGIVAGTVTTLYGFYSWSKGQGAKETLDSEFKNEMLQMRDSVNLYMPMIRNISDRQDEILFKQDEQKEAYNALRAAVMDHISKDKAMTIEDFRRYLESVPELKKNLSSD